MLPRIKSIFEHTFISSFLDRTSVVVDLGANEGGFAVPLVEEFHCQVYACEPVPEVYDMIPENFYIHKYPVCISRENGPVSLVLPVDNCASLYLEHRIENSRTIPADGITYREFLRKTGIRTVDLLKIDIEGAEIDLFNSVSDTELLNHKQVTVEFHDFMFSGLKDKFSQIEIRISNAGFYRVQFTTGSMDVLFIRKDLISYAGYLYLQFCVRYYLKLKILAQRISRKIERTIYNRTI